MDMIQKVTIVSDGIVVEFEKSVACYFSARSLYENREVLKGQVFVCEDQSLSETAFESAETMAQKNRGSAETENRFEERTRDSRELEKLTSWAR